MPAGASLLVTQGTQNNVAADQVGGASGTYYPYVRSDLILPGSSDPSLGKAFGRAATTSGEIGVAMYGLQINDTPSQLTNSGNYSLLQFDAVGNLKIAPSIRGTSINVVGTGGAAGWGTIVAACGAGTKQFVSGIDIVCVSGTGVEVVVTNIGVGGSTGAGVLARGFFGTTGGISKNFNPIQASGTNGTIAYWLGGAGTVDITVQYWQGI